MKGQVPTFTRPKVISTHAPWQINIQANLIEKEIHKRNLNPPSSSYEKKMEIKGPITTIQTQSSIKEERDYFKQEMMIKQLDGNLMKASMQ